MVRMESNREVQTSSLMVVLVEDEQQTGRQWALHASNFNAARAVAVLSQSDLVNFL